jgi:tRNA U34 5-methylaminomethyl-2-thiouridine-forming methyltransferase MnmC
MEDVMENLITALAPAFAIGLALQALTEWLDSPIEWVVKCLENHLLSFSWKPPAAKEANNPTNDEKKAVEDAFTKHKKAVIHTLSVVVGLVAAFTLNLHVLTALSIVPQPPDRIDKIVTGLIISLGTDGINQLVKFVEQAKNNQQAAANKTVLGS